jgi:hypothetical protein
MSRETNRKKSLAKLLVSLMSWAKWKVMIKKYFRRKKCRKIGNFGKRIITMVFKKKRQFFRRKIAFNVESLVYINPRDCPQRNCYLSSMQEYE